MNMALSLYISIWMRRYAVGARAIAAPSFISICSREIWMRRALQALPQPLQLSPAHRRSLRTRSTLWAKT